MNKRVYVHTCVITSLMVLLVLVNCRAVNAQEKKRAGVTMGYPASVGFVFHVTDRVALRPELSFDKSSSKQSTDIVYYPSRDRTSSSTSNDASVVGVGLSALFYAGKWDNVRTYVSPRITYTRLTTTIDYCCYFVDFAVPTPTLESPISFRAPAPEKATSSMFSGAGSFGAQYSMSSKFSLFGEVGLSYSRTTGPEWNIYSKTKSTSWSTRTGVGIVFYF